MSAPRSTHLSIRPKLVGIAAITLGVLTIALGTSFGAEEDTPGTQLGLTPSVATAEHIEETPLIDPQLTGISKDAPKLCTGTKVDTSRPITRSRERSGVGVFPAQIESNKLQPGTSYRSCIIVVNTQESPVKMRLTTIEIVGSLDPEVGLELELDPLTIGRWLHPLVNEVIAQPGQSVEIPYVIDVPTDVPAGTVVGGVRITQDAAGEGLPAAISNSVVHRIYATFPGGQQQRLEISDLRAPRLLSKKKGDLVYRTKFVVTNKGTVVDVFESKLEVSGLGRKIGDAKNPPQALLPNGATNVELVWRDLPWIGWYNPKVTVTSRAEDVEVDVPRVLILPPTIYVVALLLAVLLPILWFIWRFIRRRREWQQYVDEEYAEGEFEEL